MASVVDQEFINQTMKMACAYHEKEDLVKAEKLYQQVLIQVPHHPDANQNLGMIAYKCGHLKAAVQLIGNALAADPNRFQCYFILGGLFDKLDDTTKAIQCYKKATVLKPDFIEAQNNLGLMYKNNYAYDDAIECFKRVVAINPKSAFALGNLGNVLKESGQMVEAIDALEKASQVEPNLFSAYSNLLMALNYRTDLSAEYVYEKHKQWALHCNSVDSSRFGFRGRNSINHGNQCPKIRVAYISPDFIQHSVAYFVEPLFRGHDTASFELFAYSNNSKTDEFTTRIKNYFDHWHEVENVSDQALADLIYEDKIDILVDLSGHSANNRLAVFFQKPAPVQITWLGYPNTTGLEQIDYRITDFIADPQGESDMMNSEKLIRLENGFLCYQGDQSAPVTKEIPYDKNGYITFGSFNNLVKVTPEVVNIWSQILKLDPDSKLLLKSAHLANKSACENCLRLFKSEGIVSERIEFSGMLQKSADHLDYYGEIDIALDPFPYNGTTTTCEAIWMGVPVITYKGEVHASRVSASILSRVGLEDFIADDLEGYIRLALEKSKNLDELRFLRKSLRSKVNNSKLCDEKDFAKKMEEAYQFMWKNRWPES